MFQTYLDIRQVGTVFNCPRLLEAVDRFIRKNFTEFIRTQAFYELSENELVHYLDHNHLRYVILYVIVYVILYVIILSKNFK